MPQVRFSSRKTKLKFTRGCNTKPKEDPDAFEKALAKHTTNFAKGATPKGDVGVLLARPLGKVTVNGRRETRLDIPSKDTKGGSTAVPRILHYSGTKMLGVATLHKSNSVPVFSQQDAIDISKMRRG